MTTYEQAVQTWRTGGADGLLVPDTVTPPARMRSGPPLFRRYLVLITPRIVKDVRTALSNATVVASPEERDCLASLLLTYSVNVQSAKDIRLLTQEQYMSNTGCVDAYCTSVVEGSPFLSRLAYPFYVSGVTLNDMPTARYNPAGYTKSLNLDFITTSCYNVRRGS